MVHQRNPKMKKCKNCDNIVKNEKHNYCSRSCSTSVNNRKRTKKKYYCKKCNKLLANSYKDLEKDGRKTVCDDCNPNKIDWSKITLEKLKSTRTLNCYHTRLRSHSRNVYLLSDKPKHCINCNYTNYYEVCHIKNIKDFDKSTPVSIVNHIDNLVALCPNCHWDFDNGYLTF